MHHEQMARIRLVSRRYYELQGLRAMLVGGSFSLAMGLALTVFSDERGERGASAWASALAFGGAFAMVVPGMFWLDRYYGRTFGRIVPTVAQRRWNTIAVPGAVVTAMFFGNALGVGMALFFAASGALHLWWVIRDWPWRTHHLLGAAGAAGAVAALLSGVPAADEPLMWAFLLYGTSLIPSGMLDHLLLQRTLSVPAAPPQRERG